MPDVLVRSWCYVTQVMHFGGPCRVIVDSEHMSGILVDIIPEAQRLSVDFSQAIGLSGSKKDDSLCKYVYLFSNKEDSM
jgi:hypothetical protein